MAADPSTSKDTEVKAYTEDDLERLAAFYLECVQEENLWQLRLNLRSRNSQFIAPWSEGRENFFFPNAEQLQIRGLGRREQKFLDKIKQDEGPRTGARSRLFYGYPIYFGEGQRVAPLFFAEVEVEEDNGRRSFSIQGKNGRISVNHYLFRQNGLTPEEIIEAQEELESPFPSFAARLKAALNKMEHTFPNADYASLEPWPSQIKRTSLRRCPILFKSQHGSFTYNLERELRDLKTYDFLKDEALNTALRPLFIPSGAYSSSADTAEPAEVLPLDESQENAALSSLQAPLTVVTGPPGTGKSQVVVNLLLSAVLHEHPVLFASKNNKAVDVVRERITDILGEEFDFVLRLGNRREMEACEEELSTRLRRIEDRASELKQRYSPARRGRLQDEVQELRARVAKLDDAWAGLQEASRKREQAEAKLPTAWVEPEPPGSPESVSQGQLRRLSDKLEALASGQSMGFLLWFKRLFLGYRLKQECRESIQELIGALPVEIWADVHVRIHGSSDYGALLSTVRRIAQYRTWLERRTDEYRATEHLRSLIVDECDTVANDLEADYEAQRAVLKEKLNETFRQLIQVRWIGHVARNVKRVRQRFDTYFQRVEEVRAAKPHSFKKALDQLRSAQQALTEDLPIWIVTNLSVRRALPLRPNLFDQVIVDEASQCDIASALPLLYRAKRSTIIGDDMQLRHITALRTEHVANLARKAKASDLVADWSYSKYSLYDRAEKAYEASGNEPILLRKHYRSHPDIISFSNDAFYSGLLELERQADSFQDRIPEQWLGVQWHDVRGEVPRRVKSSARNPQEAEAVVRLINHWYEQGLLTSDKVTVGVVTPFNKQVEEIRPLLEEQAWWKEAKRHVEIDPPVTVGTAHRFQGDERDMIIFSPVVAPGIRQGTHGWVARTEQLLNVAITRARASLQIMGDLDYCRSSLPDGRVNVLSDFAEYAAQCSDRLDDDAAS